MYLEIVSFDVYSIFDKMKPVKKFRKSFLYSNMMYGFVTYLSEKIAGRERWETLVNSTIFQPLNMTSSTFISISNLTNAATGYDKGPVNK